MTRSRPANSIKTQFRISFLTGVANMAGVAVVIAFFILTDQGISAETGRFNLAASFFLLALGVVWGNLWTRGSRKFDRLDLAQQLEHPELERYQAAAVNLPLVTAFISLVIWFLAGPLIGVVGPLLYNKFDFAEALIGVFGISLIGGPITTVCVFFFIETVWQKDLPDYVLVRPIRTIPGAIRIPVKARMISAMVLVSLIPLLITAMVAFLMGQELAAAGPDESRPLLDSLSTMVTYLVLAGGGTAVGVAVFLANSIARPLRSLTLAMNRVAKADFTARVEPTANDEIGALADGFNSMIQGLAERERIRETMHRYLDPEIARQIMSGRINVEGEMKDVTLLFSDLRGFTTFAENHHPKEVLSKVNSYFSAMTRVIRDHGGDRLPVCGRRDRGGLRGSPGRPPPPGPGRGRGPSDEGGPGRA